MLLDENKDEQILKEACLGLCQLFGDGIQNDRILAILEADVVPRLVALLKPNRSRNVPVSVQAAALQVIGNVACGDNRQTQVITDCEALPCLKVRSQSLVGPRALGFFVCGGTCSNLSCFCRSLLDSLCREKGLVVVC